MNNEMKRAPMAVILAAGEGSSLGSLTEDSPKSLLPVGGSVILERIIRNCLSCGMSQFVLVLGHRGDEVRQFVDKTFRGIRVTYVINDRHRETGTGYSLMLASSVVGATEFIKFNSDVVFDAKILRALVDSQLTNVLCIDGNAALTGEKVKVMADQQTRISQIGQSVDRATALGESIGIEKISSSTAPLLFAALKATMDSALQWQDPCEATYAELVANGTAFHALDITGMNWTEIETPDDYAAANAMFGSPVTTVSRWQQNAQDEAITNPARAK